MTRDLSLCLFAGAAVAMAAGQLLAEPAGDGLDALREADRAVSALIERAEKAVVAIGVSSGQLPRRPGPERLFRPDDDGFFRDLGTLNLPARKPTPTGAGVIIDASGVVLTQYLVVRPGKDHTVMTVDGQRLAAKIVAADPRSGLAVLRIDKPAGQEGDAAFPVLAIGEAERLRKGSHVLTIGNPQAIAADGQPTAALGAVTNLARKAGDQINLNNTRDDRQGNYRTTLHHFGTLLQSDCRLGWNASGGALVDLSGRLVGITTTVSVIPGHEQPAGYAIPMNAAMRRVVEQLIEGKEVEYGLLGISFQVRSRPTASGGLAGIEVQQVYPGGPASRGGITRRDVITHVGGERTTTSDQLQLQIGQRSPGDRVLVSFERGNRKIEAELELAKHFTLGRRIVTKPTRLWRGMAVDYSTALPKVELDRASQAGLLDPQGCVVVRDVKDGSASWNEGVRPGRFISHVAGMRVRSPKEFWSAIEGASDSTDLRFTDQSPGRPVIGF